MREKNHSKINRVYILPDISYDDGLAPVSDAVLDNEKLDW